MSAHFGKCLGEFKIGDVYRHVATKVITKKDQHDFCMLTMNQHPVHLDEEYAKKQLHGRILVVGTYVLSLVVGFSVPEVSGKAIANLEYEKIIHNHPVFIGDTLRAETEVIDLRVSNNKPDRGVVSVETRAFNQDDKKVLTLRRKILVPRKGV